MAKLFDLEEKNFSDQIGSQLGQVVAAPTVQEMSVIRKLMSVFRKLDLLESFYH